jgi:hypothetical protein
MQFAGCCRVFPTNFPIAKNFSRREFTASGAFDADAVSGQQSSHAEKSTEAVPTLGSVFNRC